MKLNFENPDKNNFDRAFYENIIRHNKKYDENLVIGQCTLVCNNNQFCPYVSSIISDKKTMISLRNFSEKIIDDFKNKGYNFNHIAEMKTITISNKMDMPFDFYSRHNMYAVEWKLFPLINKTKSLMKNLNHIW